VFALLKELKLPDQRPKAKGGPAFKTTLGQEACLQPHGSAGKQCETAQRFNVAATPAPWTISPPLEIWNPIWR